MQLGPGITKILRVSRYCDIICQALQTHEGIRLHCICILFKHYIQPLKKSSMFDTEHVKHKLLLYV